MGKCRTMLFIHVILFLLGPYMNSILIPNVLLECVFNHFLTVYNHWLGSSFYFRYHSINKQLYWTFYLKNLMKGRKYLLIHFFIMYLFYLWFLSIITNWATILNRSEGLEEEWRMTARFSCYCLGSLNSRVRSVRKLDWRTKLCMS